MDFNQIPGAFPRAHYCIDVGWDFLEEHLARCTDQGFTADPDFQRAHVWTEAQQAAYVEYMLRGGEVSRALIVNAPRWHLDGYTHSALVDGKQRMEAVRRFMRNELPVFGGHFLRDFTGNMRMVNARFQWNVISMPDRARLLDLYLSINAGGTPHSPEEIARVRGMRDSLAGGAKWMNGK